MSDLRAALDSLQSRWIANEHMPSLNGWQNLAYDAIEALRAYLAAPQPEPSAGLDIERLARALRTYHSTAVKDRHTNSWSRPDPYDAAAIIAEYDRLTAEDAP